MAETQVTDCIDHAGKSRQYSRKYQPVGLVHQIAGAIRQAADDPDRFGHGFLSRNKL
jgi:hypothetical protein